MLVALLKVPALRGILGHSKPPWILPGGQFKSEYLLVYEVVYDSSCIRVYFLLGSGVGNSLVNYQLPHICLV